jgi:hypothetical protein
MFTTNSGSSNSTLASANRSPALALNNLRKVVVLLCLFSIVAAAIPVASAQTAAEVSMDSIRADRLDLDNDGTADLIRVVHLVNTSEPWASVGVEVIAQIDGMALSFWENFTVNSSAPHLGSIDVAAWSDGAYEIDVRVWDNELEVLLIEQNLGNFELTASLMAPEISMRLKAPPIIHTGESCEILRTFSDEVGDHYEVGGVLSISGVPWLVSEDADIIDCSRWPAGNYHIIEQYQNGLGFFVREELTFTILNHPPPSFDLLVNGTNGRLGEACSVEVIPEGETNLIGTSIDWQVSDPLNEEVDLPGTAEIDCTDWAPGLHKVRVTLTSPQGQATVDGVNIIKVPPINLSASELDNVSGENWPTHSAGAGYQPEPILGNSATSAAAVASVGLVVAVLLGLLAGLMLTRKKSEAGYDEVYGGVEVEQYAQSEADGLPTYTDPQGVVWRQHPDGSMDWFDPQSGQWASYGQ